MSLAYCRECGRIQGIAGIEDHTHSCRFYSPIAAPESESGYYRNPDRAIKMDQHDKWSAQAVLYLADWLKYEGRFLQAIAKGRHAEGSLRYGDRLMYEYTQDELLAEASQELGDAINYLALWLARNADG